ncbi:M23 family metallopeptidase [Rhodobacteraceae bacterium KMM 6894]|nr:M23 family metallopeptidase [Rhodobacteraceae bacterium KMM 6894]
MRGAAFACAALGLWTAVSAAQAQDDAGRPQLGLPADCILGETCFVQQYVDFDPGPGARDYMCQGLSYDGHKGTDFSLISMSAMQAGVTVIASAPGTVRGIRNDMPDRLYTDDMAEVLDGRDCGNGVAITHADGWETQYCHMRRGSVSVHAGQTVERGTPLGLIGLSGRTQFPHIHISVRKDGQPVDPFDPDGIITCGTPSEDSLWIDTPTYQPGGILAVGFANGVPGFDDIRAGTAAMGTLARDEGALVAWGYGFGGRQGDVMRITITGPDGAEVIRDNAVLDKQQAQYFRAAGKRARNDWATGSYTAQVDLMRDGVTIDSQKTTVNVD